MTKQGRVVVMLHGLRGSSLELRFFARRIRQRGFSVIALAVEGFGSPVLSLSSGAARPRFQCWIAEVATEIDRLAETYAEVYLCGVGLGATLALAVAAERPTKLDAMVLVSTMLILDGWNISNWRHLLPLIHYRPLGRLHHMRATSPYGVKNERVRAIIASKLERDSLASKDSLSLPTATLQQVERLIKYVVACLGRVRTATLMIHARDDDVASLANVHLVRRQIGTDMFRELIVEDSYSNIALDNDCDLAVEKMNLFFNSVVRTRAEALSRDT